MTRHRLFLASVLLYTLCSAAAHAEPIRLLPANPHYFLFEAKPTILITSAEHYGAVLNRPFDFVRYLGILHANGLNYTRIFGGAYVEVPAQSFGIKRNTLAPPAVNLVSPWKTTLAGDAVRYQLSEWNEEYFTRLKAFLRAAAERQIIVELTLFSSIYDEKQWAVNPFNRANNSGVTDAVDWKRVHTPQNGNVLGFQERYVRKLVRETNGFDNVILEIQNEPWSDRPFQVGVVNPYLPAPGRDRYPNSVDVADRDSLGWQTLVAGWIVAEEQALPNKHLIAQNYSNFLASAKDVCPHVSIVNFHYAYGDAARLNDGLQKAIGYDESGFLGREDAKYLRQAWNFITAGGSTFNNLDYSFSVGHEAGDDREANGPGGGSAEFRQRLHLLVDAMKSFDLAATHPIEDVVRHADGAAANALSDGSTFLLYFDGSLSKTALRLPTGSYRYEWIDTVAGKRFPAKQLQSTGAVELTPPAVQTGWALRFLKQ